MKKSLLTIILILLVSIIVVAVQMVFGKNSLRQQHRIQRENAVLQHQIDSLQTILDERNVTIERLKNDSLYIEEQLRVKYGMSRKGERVFQFVK